MDLYLFGAGASNDAGTVKPYPPPLGAELFEQLQAEVGEWQALPKPLKFLYKMHNFEEATAHIWARAPELIPPLIRGMARYFSAFQPDKRDNTYLDLLNLYTGNYENLSLATINFDLLLERTILNMTRLSLRWEACSEEAGVGLVKVHGSPGFIPNSSDRLDLADSQLDGDLVMFESGQSREGGVRRFERNQDILRAIDDLGRNAAPALGLYGPSRAAIYGKADMEAAKLEFARMVRRADRICVIGAGINEADVHIWGPIGHSKAEIHFVGSPWDERSLTNWVGKTGHARNFNASGFRAFVAGGALKGLEEE